MILFLQKYFTIDGRNLGSKHVSQKSLQDKKLLHGVKQFNLDAKNGLEYLSKSGILNKTSAKEVSLFVYCLFVWKNKQALYLSCFNFPSKGLVFCYKNCSDLLWEKVVLVIEKKFWNSRLKTKNLQNFETTRTIYSNRERSEQFLVTECFFKLFPDIFSYLII